MAVDCSAVCDEVISRVQAGMINSVELIDKVRLIKSLILRPVAGTQQVPRATPAVRQEVFVSPPVSDPADRWHSDPLRLHGIVALKVPEVDPADEVSNNNNAVSTILAVVGLKATPFSVFRMGQYKPGRTRPLKIILPSTRMVEFVLQNARKLKGSPADGQFIRRSMPRSERNVLQELFKEKKQRERETGRFHRIDNGEILDSGRQLRSRNGMQGQAVHQQANVADLSINVQKSTVQVPGVVDIPPANPPKITIPSKPKPSSSASSSYSQATTLSNAKPSQIPLPTSKTSKSPSQGKA